MFEQFQGNKIFKEPSDYFGYAPAPACGIFSSCMVCNVPMK